MQTIIEARAFKILCFPGKQKTTLLLKKFLKFELIKLKFEFLFFISCELILKSVSSENE